ncbi:MAG: hypothetical protein Q9178_003013 [Gyalolechia marmorata]
MTVRTYDQREFIPLRSMEEFWVNKLPGFLEGLGCPVDQNRAHRIETTCVRIFTALVLAEWDDDEHFRNKFGTVFRNDASPLWTNGSLDNVNFLTSDDSGLSEDEAGSLRSAVDLVAVPVLEPNKGSIKLARDTTLPITHRDEIGSGAYGTVYKIRIAEGCFMVENTTSGIVRPNKEEFALKVMKDASDSHRELEFLRHYRGNSRNSKHILPHLAIIERDKEASVIYHLASGDLLQMLEGNLESLKWNEGDAVQFRAILRNSCNLADGLDFLHTDMRNNQRLVCRHGDLKPNNFLVFRSGWKISDMGLARVQTTETDESGVRRTTGTTSRIGAASYAAPEQSGPEGTKVGRETDVWSMAAIIMEIIIWGLGGTAAWKNFVERRGKSARNGLFHANGTLSRAVDDELCSWPEAHSEKISEFLHGSKTQATRFLKDLVEALRGALVIDPNKRAKSKGFLNSMENVYKHFKNQPMVRQGSVTFTRLDIRTRPAMPGWEALQKKFDEHRQHKIFTINHFRPNEEIYVSKETEHYIEKWLRSTPSALCILTGVTHEWLHVSAIVHEVYYGARCKGYDVIEFLTLNRYNGTTTPLQASLDLVYCFIYQFLRNKSDDQRKGYDLDGLAIGNTTLSGDVNFESAVNVLGQIIKAKQGDRKSKPTIVIIDEFWQVCTRKGSKVAKQQWGSLLTLLGCGRTIAGPPSPIPNFRVLIRASGWFEDLKHLGFSGEMCTPLGKPSYQTLRDTLKDLF